MVAPAAMAQFGLADKQYRPLSFYGQRLHVQRKLINTKKRELRRFLSNRAVFQRKCLTGSKILGITISKQEMAK
ncbi:hypothetical protein [Ensifer adhaerens]|uniref:hypothetical protein n=1 Tax=Ensifer adhaerens TaxID=106592 RepID=UPI0013792381|nr:hypothetical protein [Ensifer adhaerens]